LSDLKINNLGARKKATINIYHMSNIRIFLTKNCSLSGKEPNLGSWFNGIKLKIRSANIVSIKNTHSIYCKFSTAVYAM